LTLFDLLPKQPIPFGSRYVYEKPEKEFSDSIMQVFRKMHNVDKDAIVKQRLLRELDLLEAQYTIEREIYNPVEIENAKTTDIDSDEQNIFERNLKFEEVKKRFEDHKSYSLDVMKGNDYRFNIYLRKMNKLAKQRQGGLDMEGYKDYVTNLIEFKKIKRDFEKDKDPNLEDKLEIDYSGYQHEKEAYIGKIKKSFYDIKFATTISDKKERIKACKDLVIEMIKDEIQIHKEFEFKQSQNLDEKYVI
jgi:hypothetical protein